MLMIYLAAYLVAINLIAFLTFRTDKARATAGEWRIPEKSLLALALCGGWFGAKLAQKRYRHKTRKQPFRSMLNMIPFVWCAMMVVFVLMPSFPAMNWSEFAQSAFAETPDRKTPKFFQRVSH